MIFTFFPPLSPLPDQTLDNSAYAAAHCRQTKPGQVVRAADWTAVYEWITLSERPGRKGDAGYIIAGECTTTRKEGGPAPFVLIDYDDAPPDWAELDAYEGFAWTTASHTPERPAWRVLIPLTEPAAHGKLRCPFPGGHIRNRTQPAFLPTGPTVEYRDLPGAKRLDAAELGRAETPEYEARASSMLGAVFAAARMVEGEQPGALIVRCPWQHEHTGGKGGGTVVFHDDGTGSGLGKFSCAHGHCAGRGSVEVLDVLRPLPAVTAELRHWPEPGLLGTYERQAVAPSEPEPLVTDTPVWLTGAALATPVNDVCWLVKALELAPGRCPILAADSGSGKSWSVQSIALSIASGLPVFGAFPCRRGPVFHVAEDSDIDAVRDRYQKLARGMRLSLAELDLAVYSPRFRVTNSRGEYEPKHLAAIMATAAKHNAALVIVDSLATVCVGLEENSPEIALPLYDSRHPTATVLWTHHAQKGGEGYRGSSAIRAAAGAMWVMAGKDNEPRIWANSKHAERAEKEGRLEGFKTVWDGQQISVEEDADTSAHERPADRISREILRVMADGNSTKTGILELVGGAKTLKFKVFDFLVYSRVIVHLGPRYTVAPGVPVPRVPDDIISEANRAAHARKKT